MVLLTTFIRDYDYSSEDDFILAAYLEFVRTGDYSVHLLGQVTSVVIPEIIRRDDLYMGLIRTGVFPTPSPYFWGGMKIRPRYGTPARPLPM